jgi:hypothetical protein
MTKKLNQEEFEVKLKTLEKSIDKLFNLYPTDLLIFLNSKVNDLNIEYRRGKKKEEEEFLNALKERSNNRRKTIDPETFLWFRKKRRA